RRCRDRLAEQIADRDRQHHPVRHAGRAAQIAGEARLGSRGITEGGGGPARYCATQPPSIDSAAPVIVEAASPHRNTASAAIIPGNAALVVWNAADRLIPIT